MFWPHAVWNFCLLFAFAMLAAVSTLIYFVFLLVALSSCSTALLCLSICFVWLFVWPFSYALPGFQQCTFLHTPAALLSLPYSQYGRSLLFSYSWFHLLLQGFFGIASSLHLSGPLFVFQGRFDFRYLLYFDCLFGKLFNRWPKLDCSLCLLQNFKRSVKLFW